MVFSSILLHGVFHSAPRKFVCNFSAFAFIGLKLTIPLSFSPENFHFTRGVSVIPAGGWTTSVLPSVGLVDKLSHSILHFSGWFDMVLPVGYQRSRYNIGHSLGDFLIQHYG
jgi:hypothetical protein